ncbi:MAG: adenylate/guanylate cyclase domain-containing protein [Deltaproteobacteria bacterium]|nr:adenylate/guanylate cyclase domain-containing protein [Deltaproteobacteria bacterium]
MTRFVRWLRKVNAFRIGLFTGLFFAALHGWQVARRTEVPLLSKAESAFKDIKLRTRGKVDHEPKVAVAAVDEKAIARYGRFPWDRRVLASLVDKLGEQGAAAVGFDMAFSDEDLGGQFAGAKRFRTRFEDISLASGKGKAAVDRFSEAQADISGAASAVSSLAGKIKPGSEAIWRTAQGRLEDGSSRITESKNAFDALVKEHEAYGAELDLELGGLNPDQVFAQSIKKNGKVVLGWVALTPQEIDAFTPAQIDEQVKLISRAGMRGPEYRDTEGGVTRAIPMDQRPIGGLKHYAGLRAPLPIIAEAANTFGFFNTIPDYDGVIRNVMTAMEVRGHYLPGLEMATAAVALGVKPEDLQPITGDTEDGLLHGVDLGGRFVPTDERGLLRVNYYGPDTVDPATKRIDRVFTYYSIADILGGNIPDGQIKGKVILVAATAEGTFDQRVTPFAKITPGVAVHANALQTILDQRYLHTGTVVQALEVLAQVLLAFVFGFLFARVRVSLAIPVLVLAGIAIHTCSYLFMLGGWDVYDAMPLLELASMFVFVTIYRYATEEKDKRALRKAFQLYLNPEVMDEMLGQPEKLQLGGEEKEMSVMFSDIRGFTTISEKLSPQALVKLLNDYLTPMTDIVFAKRGTLDKYIGDAVMAFFGAPIQNDKNAWDACDAALEMMETLARIKEQWRIEDPDVPDIDIGIGINSGPMVVGNMGSTQRFNYTVMGDNVNLASRLEGLNKDYGTHILISEATLNMARRAAGEGALGVRELDSVAVKGKKEPVRLFELRHRMPVPEEKDFLDAYADGLRLYRAQKFSEAKLSFERCLELHANDGASKEFLSRCDEMAANPPGEGWDGVTRMKHK